MFDQTTSQPTIISTEYTRGAMVNAARNGIYICMATIVPDPKSEFITDSDDMMGPATITVGKCYIILTLAYMHRL